MDRTTRSLLAALTLAVAAEGQALALAPAACFASARAGPSSMAEGRALSLCRDALEPQAPIGCYGKARAWPHDLPEAKAVALCRGARTAAEPLACFAEARGLRALDVDDAIELCGKAAPRAR